MADLSPGPLTWPQQGFIVFLRRQAYVRRRASRTIVPDHFSKQQRKNTMPEPLVPPLPGRLLLHSCCAPCAGEIMETLLASAVDFSIFFYNPNIHPKKEYDIRKEENIRFAEKMGIPFVDADYDKDRWFERVRGLEWEPERGQRCTA
jgi:hypothetical protein